MRNIETKNKNIFLFSIDLEDIRVRVEDGLSYEARVEVLVDHYLEFLHSYNSKATFFTVGDIPKYYPGLIQRIIDEGHEIACHSNKHLPVLSQTPQGFRDDLMRNKENLMNAGATELLGYRAPTYSVTKDIPWFFSILEDAGFAYSSSVLPAKNPLYGWEGFGQNPRKMNNGLWEIPVSIRKGSFFKVPFSGGVYFRFLPFYVIKKNFETYFKNDLAITSYFHPYDIDLEQEKFMHPEISNSWIYNQLMYYNRKSVFPRLHEIMEIFNPNIVTYKSYVDTLNESE